MLDLDPGTGRSPLDDLDLINAELRAYSRALAERQQIVVGNKVDLPGAADRAADVGQRCARRHLPFVAVSAVTGEGVRELVRLIDHVLHAAERVA
jgi:GTP-binding protein